LFIVCGRGAHCLWCPRNRWNFLFAAFVALKIGENGLEARKL